MYVKKFDENGIVTNPITKNRPFLNSGDNRKTRRFNQRKSNNRKGDGQVIAQIGVTSFVRYRIVKQHVPGAVIIHSIAV